MQKRSSISSQSLTDSKNELVSPKNPAAVELGRLGGLKGGKARADKLSPKRRSQIAKQAAEARWNKQEQRT